jgi:hypothetical protein
MKNKSNISILNLEEAKKILPKESDYYKYTKNEDGYENFFIYVDGDYEIENLDLDNIGDYFETKNKHIIAIIVNGNLKVQNIYNDETDGSCGIVTLGNLTAQNIVVGGQEIYVGGHLTVTDLYWGDYNHGSLQVVGKMDVNVLVDTDYSLPKDLYTQKTFDDERGKINYRFSDEIDEVYELDILKVFFNKAVLEEEDDLDEDEIYGWGSLLSRDSVLEKLEAKEKVLLTVFDDEAYINGLATDDDDDNQQEQFDNQPPFKKDKVTILDIEYEVLRINEGLAYYENLYWGIETDKEEIGSFGYIDPESYFLLHKNPLKVKNLDVEAITDAAYDIDLQVAGLVFMSDIQVENQLIAQDLDTGPSFMCLGNITAKNIALFGNTYYVAGNMQCECLFGFYNHGSLYVSGTLQAVVIIADDFSLSASTVLTWALIEESDWRVRTTIDAVLDGELTGQKIVATLTQTHHYEEVLLNEMLNRADENGYSNYYSALLDYFEQGKTVFDYEKMQLAITARIQFLKESVSTLWHHPYLMSHESWAEDDYDIMLKPNEYISITLVNTYGKFTQQLFVDKDNEMSSFLYYKDDDDNDIATYGLETDSKDILGFMIAFTAQEAIQSFIDEVSNKPDLSNAEEVQYNDQSFKLISVKEATQLTKEIKFIDGSLYYDFENDKNFFETPQGKKGVFLYKDEECAFENFNLLHTIDAHENLHVLAVIFTKNVDIENAITSLSDTSAPALIALEDFSALFNLFEKGLHYIQGDFESHTIICKGNEGALLIKGDTNAYFMYTEAMKICATSIDNVSAVISAQYFNPLVYHLMDTMINGVLQQKWYPCPNTNRLSHLAYDNWILATDDSEVLIWKDTEGTMMYQEFLDGNYIIDDDLAESNDYEEEEEEDESYFDSVFNDAFFTKEKMFFKHFHNHATEIVCERIEESGNRYDILCVMNHIHYFNLRYIQINNGENHVITAEFYKDKERNELESDFRYETQLGAYPLRRAIMYAAFMAKSIFENRDKDAFYLNQEIIQTTTSNETTMFRLKLTPQLGFGEADASKVKELQNKYGFSEEYATFLETQNGFNSVIVDNESNVENTDYVTKTNESVEDFYQDVAFLYGIGDNLEHYYDLEHEIEVNIFSKHFFIIGRDAGGNEFVEILHGKYKGYIGCIDHDMYAGNETLDEFIEDMDLEGFEEGSLKKQCNMLVDEDLGLMVLHAKNMNDFILNKLFVNSNGNTYAKEM